MKSLGELERKRHIIHSRNWKELSLRFLLDIKRAFEDDLEKKRAFSSVLELLSLVVLSLSKEVVLCVVSRCVQGKEPFRSRGSGAIVER